MRSAQENRILGRIIVGAMCIDGTLGKKEREHVAVVLGKNGASDLVSSVGIALDEDLGDFDLFKECRDLLTILGPEAKNKVPDIFNLVARVVASDRFVSAEEASFLSALSRRLKLSTEKSKSILKKIIEEKRGRLEISGEQVDAMIHPHLKELLSFCGADEVVGEIAENSIAEQIYLHEEEFNENLTLSDVENALKVLGLSRGGSLDEAEEIWKEKLEATNLGKLAYQGEAFVTSALENIQRIHNAYKTLINFEKMRSKSNLKSKSDSESEKIESLA
ncbi:MAG TPA: hypothetical protein PKA63_06065 [Oligoflexia bacterium]|nr:hypothetical protein [Oligoflexia bacterium]HMP48215.1 hypothetical protein [Oligoflexia bacterium]